VSDTAPAPAPTLDELEAELAERRAHLSTTIDELVTRVSPGEIARRGVEDVRLRVAAATHTPEGELRSELVAGLLGAVSLVLIVAGLRRRYRG
jgi:hypothetical protein